MEILNGGELFDRIVLKQFYNEKEARSEKHGQRRERGYNVNKDQGERIWEGPLPPETKVEKGEGKGDPRKEASTVGGPI